VVEVQDRAAGAAAGSAASEVPAAGAGAASVAEASVEPAVAVTLAAADQEAVGESDEGMRNVRSPTVREGYLILNASEWFPDS
jgi:hypothetical protein